LKPGKFQDRMVERRIEDVLSPYHFARQFKAATGLPPHQYVIARRVERAKGLLQGGDDFSLAQVAARRLRRPEPVLPLLQAPRRRHAGAVPDARKSRPKTCVDCPATVPIFQNCISTHDETCRGAGLVAAFGCPGH
jgi:hypothetical protein